MSDTLTPSPVKAPLQAPAPEQFGLTFSIRAVRLAPEVMAYGESVLPNSFLVFAIEDLGEVTWASGPYSKDLALSKFAQLSKTSSPPKYLPIYQADISVQRWESIQRALELAREFGVCRYPPTSP